MHRLPFSLHRDASRRGAPAFLLAVALAMWVVTLDAQQPTVAAAKAPRLRAAAAAVMDQTTGRFVYLWHADKRVAMASTTKIMTGKLVLDSGIPLDKVVTVGELELRWDESEVGLRTGARLTVDQLLRALLVASANDAARVLAVAVAGSEAAFVKRMNAEARRLGLDATHFANPHGMDEPGHHTSARDLTELARVALQDERFASYVRLSEIRLPRPEGKGSRRISTTDTFLLAHPDWVYGVKTGYTFSARSCLVSAGSYKGEPMIVTLLGSPDPETRNKQALGLYRHALSLYRPWHSPPTGSVLARVGVPYSRRPLSLKIDQSFSLRLPPGAAVAEALAKPKAVALPITVSHPLGRVRYSVDGQLRGERLLLVSRTIPAPDWRTRLRFRLWDTWEEPASAGSLLQRAWDQLSSAVRSAGQWFGELL